MKNEKYQPKLLASELQQPDYAPNPSLVNLRQRGVSIAYKLHLTLSPACFRAAIINCVTLTASADEEG